MSKIQNEASNDFMVNTSSVTPSHDINPRSPDVIVRGNSRGFLQEIESGTHHLQADEPTPAGGTNKAPGPYDYLLMALGSCTSMTVGWYARRNQIPLENVTVSLWHSRIHARDCETCETQEGMLDRIDTRIDLTGPLTPAQRQKLIEIASKCPVHRTLKSEINIRLEEGQPS